VSVVAADVLGLAPWMAALAVAIVFVGAATQASIGVGLGLVAAPTLSLMDPAFIPGALTISIVPLVVGMTVREHVHVDRTIYKAIPGRLVGSLAGAWVVATGGQDAVVLVVGIAVLLAVAASLSTVHFSPTAGHLVVAGTASGFAGTVAGVGGPPMAITYQHSDPRTLRASLAAFNTIGLLAFTLPSLVVAGVIGRREVELACLLVPGVVGGLWSGKYLIARLPPDRVRAFVLGVCAVSAVVLLARQFL
jgi:uncharacterized membrane protein YfcA